jgi:hypothetical protein
MIRSLSRICLLAALVGCARPTVEDRVTESIRSPGQNEVVNVMRDCAALGYEVVGDGCTDDGPAINACLAAHPGSRIYFPKRATPDTDVSYYSSQTIQLAHNQTIEGSARGWNSGTIISFTPACPGDPLDVPPSASGVLVSASSAVIRDITLRGMVACSRAHASEHVPNSADGIQIRAGAVRVDNVYVCGFGRDGISIAREGGSLQDYATLTNVMSEANVRNGFYWSGLDTNIGSCVGCQARLNAGYGFYDDSTSGNVFLAPLAELDSTGSFFSSDGTTSVYVTPWAEGHRPRFGRRSVVINPIGGTTPDWTSYPNVVATGDTVVDVVQLRAREVDLQSTGPLAQRSDTYFATGTPNTWGAPGQAAFYVGDDDANAQMLFGRSEIDGWWCWRGWNAGDWPGHAQSAMCMSDASTPTGTGTPWPRSWFPHGYFVGSGTSSKRWNVDVVASPPTEPCDPASTNPLHTGVRYADTPQAGGWLGWVCTTSGWRRFGAIEP